MSTVYRIKKTMCRRSYEKRMGCDSCSPVHLRWKRSTVHFTCEISAVVIVRSVHPSSMTRRLSASMNDLPPPPSLQGVIEDRIGFFPAAFAHQLQAGDQVFRCNRTFIGCKEQGQITLKEGQVRNDVTVPCDL